MTTGVLAFLFLTGIFAGAQNALAGGGSFITLPALMLTGMSAFAANLTSTVALFPGQVTTGLAGRSLARGAAGLSFRALLVISLTGGILGAILLLITPASLFARLVPYLVLFATAVFAWGSFGRNGRDGAAVSMSPAAAAVAQFAIAIYGGYFGGGIGFLMLAAFALAGMPTRNAAATKNILAGVLNASAVAIFAFSRSVHWPGALALGAGAIIGGFGGAFALRRVNERLLRFGVVAIGIALTIGLFVHPV